MSVITSPTRVAALKEKIKDAEHIIADGIRTQVYDDKRQLASIAILYSGGNDSTILAHLMRKTANVAVHANTGIGIEATRQFVRDTCAGWDLPLLEKHPPTSYEELVLDQGFPGPAHHYKMFQRLKERCIEAARSELNPNPYKYRVVFLGGRRRSESQRRSSLPTTTDRKGSMVFISPIINWTHEDMNTYRAVFPDVPRNEVSDIMHMSGECLCGSFAAEGEREEIKMWFPEVDSTIRSLEQRVTALGTIRPEHCVWGWGAFVGKGRKRVAPKKTGYMCSTCEDKFDDPVPNGAVPKQHTPGEACHVAA